MRYTPGKIKDYITEITWASGKKYMDYTGKEYIGYYHVIGDQPYTGAVHDNFSVKLLKYNTEPNRLKYSKLNDFYMLDDYRDPKSYFPFILDKEYEKGMFTRYFIKKRNDELSPILEIEKKYYEKLNRKKVGINENYYFGIKLDWKLTGPKNDVKKNGNIVIYGIEDTNKRTVLLKEKEMKNIKNVLISYLQFSRIII